MVHYRSIVSHHLLPEFGRYAIEDVTTEMIEDWLRPSEGSPATRLKNFVALSGIFRRARKVWRLPVNPATDVERPPVGQSGDIEVFSPEEVWALVRPRRASRTARSISRPRSPGCGWVSCWR